MNNVLIGELSIIIVTVLLLVPYNFFFKLVLFVSMLSLFNFTC